MMFKKFRKYLIVLMAVVMVASFAAIPVDACTLEGGYSDDIYPLGGVLFAYGAEAWAYCADSPYWCYLNTTAGYSSDGGDPGMGDDTARASVYKSGIIGNQLHNYYIISAGYGCYYC